MKYENLIFKILQGCLTGLVADLNDKLEDPNLRGELLGDVLKIGHTISGQNHKSGYTVEASLIYTIKNIKTCV